MELSSLEAAALARPRAAPATPRAATSTAVKPGASPAPPATRAATTARPAPAARTPNGAARRLDADDLFGMAELTGDAPLGELPPSPPTPRPAPAPAAAKPASKPMPNFDDIDLVVSESPEPPPPPKPARTTPPPPPQAEEPAAPPQAEAAAEASGGEAAAVKLGAFKASLKDPFEGINLADSGAAGGAALEPSAVQKKEAAKDEAKPGPRPGAPPEVPPAPGREMVSSALTGLLGAALAIAVVVAAALNDDAAAGWLGLGPGTEIVATRVVSGLYDTVAGKPVFFVRGRIENRSQRVRGPVRVVAELVAEGGPDVRAEAIAGSEPTPEDVWSLRTAIEADKLTRVLEGSPVERHIQPGGSLPFFAVIADPPADLGRHKLHVKVEPVDAWIPPTAGKAQKDGRR